MLREVRCGHQVTECVPRSGGQLSQVYEARFADGTRPLIIKIYAEPWPWKQGKEVYVYQLLHRHLMSCIPTVLHAGSSPEQLGSQAYTVMTMLPGQPLLAVSPSLADDEIFGVYRQMGSILAELHRIAQDAFGYLVTAILDPKPTNAAYMTGQFGQKLRQFADLGGDPALRAAMDRYVTDHQALFADCPGAALCHNDFHEGNILVDRDERGGWQVTGFIDVENAIAADPLIDLAKTDCYSIRGHRAKLAGLLAGYGPCGVAWTGRLAIYRLYHALELWDWFAALGQAQPLGGLADDMHELVSGAGE
jgi:aminoglycoside phosphotransferase (APT) family kinase protein